MSDPYAVIAFSVVVGVVVGVLIGRVLWKRS